jgi:hypothetical protein
MAEDEHDDDEDDDAEPVPMILIVTGSALRAEEVDRPLAYYLKQQLESALMVRDEPIPVCVVADFRWIHDEPLQTLPTISLGGPGVNALTHRWLEEVPLVLAVDDEYYLQLSPDSDPPIASIWGMNNAHTQLAVAVFVQRHLSTLLDAVARHFED